MSIYMEQPIDFPLQVRAPKFTKKRKKSKKG